MFVAVISPLRSGSHVTSRQTIMVNFTAIWATGRTAISVVTSRIIALGMALTIQMVDFRSDLYAYLVGLCPTTLSSPTVRTTRCLMIEE